MKRVISILLLLFFLLLPFFRQSFVPSASAAVVPTPSIEVYPPGVPEYQTPAGEGFSPLDYPCNDETGSEFHPLRPYPASPCDPLIPRKVPEAPLSPDKLYLTFTCNKTAYPQGTYTFPDVVDSCSLDPFDIGTATPDELYSCGGEVCSLRRVRTVLNVDMTWSRLPIESNSQHILSDSAKVNHYLQWYLNGTVQESEQRRLSPDSQFDIDRLINFSGPLKKTLSQDLQLNLKQQMSGIMNAGIGSQYHDYIIGNGLVFDRRLSSIISLVDPSFNVNIPFATNEDVTGEVNISIHPVQPPEPPIDGYLVIGNATYPMTLTIMEPADSRIYFSGVKNSNAMADILSGLIRPQITPTPTISTVDPRLVTQEITSHQGDDGTVVQWDNDSEGKNPRNTEIWENHPAPEPLFSPSPPECDMINVRSNPGNDLVGSIIQAELIYWQVFRYTPAHFFCFPQPCAEPGDSCYSSSDCCWTGGDCEGGDSTFACRGGSQCDGVAQAGCSLITGCSWDQEAGSCENPTTELDSAFAIATFTKSPFIERIYYNLISSDQSVLRRFIPQSFGAYTYATYVPKTKNETVKAYSPYFFYPVTSTLNSPRVDTLDHSHPLMYFPHLGSLSDYFLGGNPFDCLNLQKTLRPWGYHPYPGALSAGDNCPPTPTPGPAATGLLQHLFEDTCGSVCYDYVLNRVLSDSSCNGRVLNPYFAIAIALNENGGLLSCEPGGTRYNHYGCDMGGALYGDTIEEKTSCMINTLRYHCQAGDTDLANLQNYGYVNGAADLSPLAVLGNPTNSLFVSPSDAAGYASDISALLPTQRQLWWQYYCGYINTYGASQCGVNPDACNTPAP